MNTNRESWQSRGAAHRKIAAASRATQPVSGALQGLQRRYRAALSGAVVAKARYLAQAGEGFATAISIERALWRWQRIEGCRLRLAAQISRLKINADFADLPQQRELHI
jgi:hypothetical protein